MTRYEHLKFLKSSDIAIDIATGLAYALADSSIAGKKRFVYLESADIERLVNNVIELCAQTVMTSLIGSEPTTTSEVRDVFDSLKVK
jgi:DNA-directed RNA polymerase subunit F